MKRIMSDEKKKFIENFAAHVAAGTLKFTVLLNGKKTLIRKYILPLSEFPEVKNARKMELVPAAKADGTFTFIAEFTMQDDEVIMYEYINACPPFCTEESIVKAIIEQNSINQQV